MGVRLHNLVMYGVKLPYIYLNEEIDSQNAFMNELYKNHDPLKYNTAIDPNKIYFVSDGMSGKYTVVGYVIDSCDYEDGCIEGFVDLTTVKDPHKIYEFLWKKEFEDKIGDDVPDAELLIFTHAS
jgi:hypothetical protein